MSDNNRAMVISEVGPELFTPPHILPVLIELLTAERQLPPQQVQLFDHLITCHYCRTAVIVLLSIVERHDHQNNMQEDTAHELLERFAHISRKIEAIEAFEDERLGMFAEAIVAEGQDKAASRFPGMAAHVKICPDCCAVLEATVASLRESKGIG